MIVLDTNVISEFARLEPDRAAARWLRLARLETLYTCTPVVQELWYGARYLQAKTGSTRLVDGYRNWLDRVIGARILSYDRTAAMLCAEIRADAAARGATRQPDDSMIAAICIANGATLATRNVSDFEGLDLKLTNPFEPA